MSKALPLVTRHGDRIAIVNGLRTPFAKQATAYHGIPAVDLGKTAVSELLARSGIDPQLIEQLVFGQVVDVYKRQRVQHETFSRETFLLGNNVLLIAAMLVVLLGTLLPLVHKQLGLGSISIGEPFFNTMFTWLMAPLALLLLSLIHIYV